jgi:hypothetical protein
MERDRLDERRAAASARRPVTGCRSTFSRFENAERQHGPTHEVVALMARPQAIQSDMLRASNATIAVVTRRCPTKRVDSRGAPRSAERRSGGVRSGVVRRRDRAERDRRREARRLVGDDDDRRDGRVGNRDPSRARGAAADTRAMLVVPTRRGRFVLVAGRGDVVPVVLRARRLGGGGGGSLVRSAQPQRAGLSDRERDPERDEG